MNLQHDLNILAVAIKALPGQVPSIRLIGSSGPVRDQFLKRLLQANQQAIKIPCTVEPDRLVDGLDIAASLASGTSVQRNGLLSIAAQQKGLLILAMAERLPLQQAALIAQALDEANITVIAFDESNSDDPPIALCLQDRLPICLNVNTIDWLAFLDNESDTLSAAENVDDTEVAAIQRRFATLQTSDVQLNSLCEACIAVGLDSLRIPLAAQKLARVHAACYGKDSIDDEDITFAARLVIAANAKTLPNQSEQDSSETAPPEQNLEPPLDTSTDTPASEDQQAPSDEQLQQALNELLIEATLAAIPPNLLASLSSTSKLKTASGQSGASQKGGQRGRAIGVFRKKPSAHSRIHLLHTLRAALPWQTIRPQLNGAAQKGKIQVRKDDFRYARIKQKSKSTVVFAIDASGSSALHRLGEAKGAIELLLAQCYVRRDQVAVIGFRGDQAENLLPPTRSLTRAKRSLSGLPGGGGTPLASALDLLNQQLQSIRKRGETPYYVMLTDGRANIARDGKPGREQAQFDAMQSAALTRSLQASGMVIDTSPQPHRLAQELAQALQAQYLPLPFAGAEAISHVVQKAYRAAR